MALQNLPTDKRVITTLRTPKLRGFSFPAAVFPKPPGPEIVFSDTSREFRSQTIAKKSPPNFGGSERFVYLCVRKITTNETTYEYPLT